MFLLVRIKTLFAKIVITIQLLLMQHLNIFAVSSLSSILFLKIVFVRLISIYKVYKL